jgi:hypothetical protein
MGADDRIPTDPASSMHNAPMKVRPRSLPEHDTLAKIKEDMHQEDLRLVARGTLEPSPLFRTSPHTTGHPGHSTHRKRPANRDDPGCQARQATSSTVVKEIGPTGRQPQA